MGQRRHATNHSPRGHLLVMCEGNFQKQALTDAQVTALVLAWACVRYDLPLHRIKGHRDFASTACPGDGLYRLLEDASIRRRVRRRINGGGVSLRARSVETAVTASSHGSSAATRDRGSPLIGELGEASIPAAGVEGLDERCDPRR